VSPAGQGDLLLWVAGAVVAVIGIAWLVIMQPWAGGEDLPGAAAPVMLAVAPLPAPSQGAEQEAALEAGLDNPLRMAQLAYDAGMLIEPAEYSAWTLYGRAVKAEPNNPVAAAGLARVADDLVRRGEAALEQGRFDDARNAVERIRAALPQHPGAKMLADKIWPQPAPTRQATAESLRPALPQPTARVEAAEPTPRPPAAQPVVNPILVASAAFEQAMAESRLLAPTDRSAKHFVEVLTAANRDHELTRQARQRLAGELLSRAAQSLEALDAIAAGIWIDEAESIGADANRVRVARAALTEQLITLEAAKRLPASALQLAAYVAPVYPARALERGIEGWVDVEFTVGTDGTARDVFVADGSHETFFRREAVIAVEQWRFEPRVFMNRAIEQRSYTRIRFVQ
jgi:TonB family protein